jgi:hypothetical protein
MDDYALIADWLVLKRCFWLESETLIPNQVVKCLGVRFDVLVNLGFSLVIDDAYIHFPCMQIDAAIVFVLLIVESHGLASFHLNGFGFGEPILNL